MEKRKRSPLFNFVYYIVATLFGLFLLYFIAFLVSVFMIVGGKKVRLLLPGTHCKLSLNTPNPGFAYHIDTSANPGIWEPGPVSVSLYSQNNASIEDQLVYSRAPSKFSLVYITRGLEYIFLLVAIYMFFLLLARIKENRFSRLSEFYGLINKALVSFGLCILFSIPYVSVQCEIQNFVLRISDIRIELFNDVFFFLLAAWMICAFFYVIIKAVDKNNANPVAVSNSK